MVKGEEHLYFKVRGVLFKQTGCKRDSRGNFDLIRIKNCSKRTYKWIRRKNLENILEK